MTLWPIIIFGLFLLLIVLLLYFPPIFKLIEGLYNRVEKSEAKIKFIMFLTALLTIFSILFAIGTYYGEKAESEMIQQEDEEIILDLAKVEMKSNFNIISYFEKNKENYMKTGDFILTRYKYHFLEKTLPLIKHKKMRENIMVTIDDMEQTNDLMDFIITGSHFFSISNKEKYFEAKQLNINRTSEQNQMILEGLKLIKDCLETEFCLEEEG